MDAGPAPAHRDADVVVVGGGHNGLICAAYVARAGADTLLLEARTDTGGCASTVEALGARFNVCNCDHVFVRATPIADELDLARHGLRYIDLEPAYLALRWEGGTPWTLHHDANRTIEGLRRTHPDQAQSYERYLRVAMPLARLMVDVTAAVPTPGQVVPAVLRRRLSGVRSLLSWSRQSALDVLRSFFSDDDLVVPALTTGPVVWGVDPASPGTGMAALGYALKHVVPVGRPVGGSGALTDAVRRSFEAAGGRVRCNSRVVRVLVEDGAATGVRLADGTEIRSGAVVTACDPGQVVLEFLGSGEGDALPRLRRWRSRWERLRTQDGYESKIDAVLDEVPRYHAAEAADLGDVDPAVPTALVSPSPEAMSEAHRHLPLGVVAPDPMMIVNVPSVPDPSMAPGPGRHVLSLEVLWTPYDLAGGWSGSPEPARWLKRWASLVQPGFLDHVVDWRVMGPPDYEQEFSMPRGYAPSFGGTPLDALLGRRPELTRYRTPVRHLHMCGAGTFPGAGIWGASGRNAARVVLEDLERAGRPRRRFAAPRP